MMKILLLILTMSFGLMSCKKDHSCVCTLSGTVNGKETQTITDTKKKAIEKCDEGDSSGGGQIRQCEIQD